MRPTLGRVVIYTRAPGEEYAATITRVTPRGAATHPAAEVGFDVFLAIALVYDQPSPTDGAYGRTWFTPGAVNYSETPPMANTWRWPPRV